MNMLVDITEIKMTQQALKMIEDKKNDLSQSNTSLREINEELEQFAYITSHDLKEPVRKIHVFSERLKESNGMLDERSKTYIDKIIYATDRMGLLIDEVLNYSRLGQHASEFVKTDLNTVFKTVLEDLDLRIEQKNATIECMVLPVAEVIPIQITQLFYNIISNSLKFCSETACPK